MDVETEVLELLYQLADKKNISVDELIIEIVSNFIEEKEWNMSEICIHDSITIILEKETNEYLSIKCNECGYIFNVIEFRNSNFRVVNLLEK